MTEPQTKRRKLSEGDANGADIPSEDAAATTLAEFGFTPGAYSQREQYLQKLEDEGHIEFRYVVNDGQPQNMAWLVGLKTIFSRQLPNMPREYIVRLVLDRRHRSVAVVRSKTKQVVGGITYRTFPEQRFGEIAFCAITSNEQVKGFGTRLMNYTKEYAKHKDNLEFFLTYADNNAVGYFTKQGFTKEITMPRDRWVGYIKDYDGGTLMEALLHPTVDYTRFAPMLLAQRKALADAIRGFSNSHVVHKGLTFGDPATRQPLAPHSIPGVIEAGYKEQPDLYSLVLQGRAVPPDREHLQAFLEQLLDAYVAQDESWPFREPVPVTIAPDYYDVIKDPIDLQTMRGKLNQGNYYINLELFVADLRRMMDNCRVYNAPDTPYFKLANKMDAFLDGYLDSHVQWHTPV